ncbi:hypothetical protein ABZ297_44270, partial [Nonomuraea sp. NPDC005983]|uniref:hypothetical protein n=1 Tax=Nonomuraea sp. NPDC005983 TaxID=3155595 RepID=UPI0033B3F804
MDRVHDRPGGWASGGRRAAAVPHAPVVAGALLALLALAESLAHARTTPLAYAFGHTVSRPVGETVAHLGGPPPVAGPGAALYYVVFGLLGLAATLPIALLWAQPAAAAAVVSATSLLSAAAFQTLTVAGVAAVGLEGFDQLVPVGSRALGVLGDDQLDGVLLAA